MLRCQVDRPRRADHHLSPAADAPDASIPASSTVTLVLLQPLFFFSPSPRAPDHRPLWFPAIVSFFLGDVAANRLNFSVSRLSRIIYVQRLYFPYCHLAIFFVFIICVSFLLIVLFPLRFCVFIPPSMTCSLPVRWNASVNCHVLRPYCFL